MVFQNGIYMGQVKYIEKVWSNRSDEKVLCKMFFPFTFFAWWGDFLSFNADSVDIVCPD